MKKNWINLEYKLNIPSTITTTTYLRQVVVAIKPEDYGNITSKKDNIRMRNNDKFNFAVSVMMKRINNILNGLINLMYYLP